MKCRSCANEVPYPEEVSGPTEAVCDDCADQLVVGFMEAMGWPDVVDEDTGKLIYQRPGKYN